MCRMFALVSKNFVSGDNFFRFRELAGKKNRINEETHENGWGIAGYLGNWTVHFGRSERNVLADVKQYVSAVERAIKSKSRIVLAHLRNASMGEINICNTHPFIHKEWVFSHNGTIYNAEKIAISGYMYEGSTDSEKFFSYLINNLSHKSINDFGKVIRNRIQYIKSEFKTTSLTFLLSNGDYLIGFRDFSQDECYYTMYFKKEDDLFMFCSEPLDRGEWIEMKNGQLIIINKFGEVINDTIIQASSFTPYAASN